MSIEIPIEALFQKVQLTPCVNCQKPTTKRCGGCKVLYFCSRSCMKKQWKEHKNECKQIQAQKKYIIDVKKKLNQEQGNPYINHVKTKPYELNTAKYSIHDYFGWREDPKLVAQKEQNREELINWTKKTFPEFRVETIKKIKTCKSDVVFDPRVSKTLLSHISSLVNGSSIARGSSFLSEKMNAV